MQLVFNFVKDLLPGEKKVQKDQHENWQVPIQARTKRKQKAYADSQFDMHRGVREG